MIEPDIFTTAISKCIILLERLTFEGDTNENSYNY